MLAVRPLHKSSRIAFYKNLKFCQRQNKFHFSAVHCFFVSGAQCLSKRGKNNGLHPLCLPFKSDKSHCKTAEILLVACCGFFGFWAVSFSHFQQNWLVREFVIFIHYRSIYKCCIVNLFNAISLVNVSEKMILGLDCQHFLQ